MAQRGTHRDPEKRERRGTKGDPKPRERREASSDDDTREEGETSADSETRELRGMSLATRFALLMSLVLAIVMCAAGYLLYANASDVAHRAQEAIMVESVQLTGQYAHLQAEIERLRNERDALKLAEEEFAKQRLPPEALAVRDRITDLRLEKTNELRAAEQNQAAFWQEHESEWTEFEGSPTFRSPMKYGEAQEPGFLYRYKGENKDYDLLVPANVNQAEQGLLKLIVISIAAVILVGAVVSVLIANQVARPIKDLVFDIQQISNGILDHRTHASGGEVGLLAQSINKMAKNLAEARETELELSIREREVAVAGEVREALLPESIPSVPGYELGADRLASQELSGDFHDFIVPAGGSRVGLLVCDVSGKGLPGAMVGPMARSYLRAELSRGGDVTAALHLINRQISNDMRRGMFVTALYVLVDAEAGTATIASAGHKLPLVRYTAADSKVRLIQPEGIAFGFDNKGPVFERALKVQQVPLARGDRLVLANTGAVAVTNPDKQELGEKALYGHILRQGGGTSAVFLQRLRAVLENHAGGEDLPRDISIVTISRK